MAPPLDEPEAEPEGEDWEPMLPLEPGLDGDDEDEERSADEPDDESGPRSQPAITPAPSARDAATARVVSFMLCLLGWGTRGASKLRARRWAARRQAHGGAGRIFGRRELVAPAV